VTIYIHAATQEWPLTQRQIEARHPDVSFPYPFDPSALGYHPVQRVDQPAFDWVTHEVREIAPMLVGDTWTQQWEVVALSQEQVAINAAAKAEQIAAEYTAKLEDLYDSVAARRSYGIPGVPPRVMCSLRAGYPGPFQQEGIAFGSWMDDCNAHGYTVMAAVQAGERPLPTWEELAAELPAAPW